MSPRRRHRVISAALAAVTAGTLVMGCSASSAARAVAEHCERTPDQPLPPDLALPEDRLTLGVNPDWEAETLAQFAEMAGVAPGVAGTFVQMPLTPEDLDSVRRAADEVAAMDGVLMLTLEPHRGLDAVDDRSVRELVDLLATVNEASVPVLLRFAHEMNGSWYPWGQQPQAYIDVFRSLAQAVRAGTSATQMMWAPNYGGGYPFSGGDYAGAEAAIESGDPYEPYYPGDDVVDWVGLTIYHWGGAAAWDGNHPPEPGKFAQQLRGTYNGLAGDQSELPDFYARYAQEKGKPMAIPETAAFVTAAADSDRALEIKQGWWQQVFSEDLREELPQLRLVTWFNFDKAELESVDLVRWSVTTDERIAEEFRSDVPSRVAGAQDMIRCPEPPQS